MKKIKLLRVCENSDGTFGVLIFCGEKENFCFAVTLERQWKENQTGISCIPTGTYTCKRVTSPRFGVTFEVTNVQGRKHILFHTGNIDDDTHGCILPAEQFDPVGGENGVTSSGEGFKEFMEIIRNDNEFILEVIKYG